MARVRVLDNSCFFLPFMLFGHVQVFLPGVHCLFNSERMAPMRRISSFRRSWGWCSETGRDISWKRPECSTPSQIPPPDIPSTRGTFSLRSGEFHFGPSGSLPLSPSDIAVTEPGLKALSGRPTHDLECFEENGPGSVSIGLPENASGPPFSALCDHRVIKSTLESPRHLKSSIIVFQNASFLLPPRSIPGSPDFSHDHQGFDPHEVVGGGKFLILPGMDPDGKPGR